MVELELEKYNIKVNWIEDRQQNKCYNQTIKNNIIICKSEFYGVYLNLKIYPNDPISEYCTIENSESSFIIGKKTKTIPKTKYKVNSPYNFIIKNNNFEYITKTVKCNDDTITIEYDMDYQEMLTQLFIKIKETFENSEEIIDLIILEVIKNCI